MIIRNLLIIIFFPGLLAGQFMGGAGNGYAFYNLNSLNSISKGGFGDGYTHYVSLSNISVSKGGFNDGYHGASMINNISVSKGGDNDGYDLSEHYLKFIWSGTISSDWNNTSNWQTNIIPGKNEPVIIPEDADIFPELNSGILLIGAPGGDYSCRSLSINTGAEMTLGTLAYLENNGIVIIDGALIINNNNTNALRNYNCGLIRIKTGGLLILDSDY